MDWRTNRARLLLPGLIAALAGGCIEREGRPVNPCTQVTVAQQIQVNNVDKVDLLFMVDNSNSMSEEQASLAAEFPRMIEILASGDFELDEDLMGPNDFTPVKHLNVGVITSDMGVGGNNVPTCLMRDFGDDGILRTAGRADLAGCMATYPPFLSFESGGSQSAADFARDVSCVARTGIGGCGFEQQLEAILKAITPTGPTDWTSPDFHVIGTPGAPDGLDKPFFRGTSPHGNVENDGFLRPDAVLAIIPVTDEEDCSAADPSLFDPASTTYTGDLNLRCFSNPQALHPISRYVTGMLQTRVRPNLLIYAPITGIPVDLAPDQEGEEVPYDLLISPDPMVRDDRMEEKIDPSMPNRLVPSCNVPDRGVAFPPVRLVQTAQALQLAGAGVTVQSICQESFRGALTEIIRQIKSALNAACLPRPLNVESDGKVSCDVVSVMPAGMPCESISATPKMDENGQPLMEGENNDRAVCVVEQLVPTAENITAKDPPAGTGWFYDYYTEEGQENCQEAANAPFQRIAFAGQEPPAGAVVRLECFLSVQGDGTNNVQIGTFCDPAGSVPEENACGTVQNPANSGPLSCDPITRACGVSCEADTDCRNAGLIGYVCDKRPRNEIDPDYQSVNGEAPTDPYNYCVNPTCS